MNIWTCYKSIAWLLGQKQFHFHVLSNKMTMKFGLRLKSESITWQNVRITKCSLDLTAQKLGFFCVHNGAEYQIKFLLVPFCFISPICQGFPDFPSGRLPCTPSKYDRGVVMVNTLVEPLLSLFIKSLSYHRRSFIYDMIHITFIHFRPIYSSFQWKLFFTKIRPRAGRTDT